MEHVVFFPASDGTPAFRRVATLEDAIRLVEHLRNVEGVAEVSVHPLGAELPLAFRTWYRVELPEPAAAEPLVPVQPAALAGLEPAASAEQPAASAEQPGEQPGEQPAASASQPAEQPGEQPGEPEPAGIAAPGPVPAAEPVVAAGGREPASNRHGDRLSSLGFFAT